MSNIKCPFCGVELVRHWGMEEPALYCCDNPKCSRGGVATESSWQELDRIRKALDSAIDLLNMLYGDYNLDWSVVDSDKVYYFLKQFKDDDKAVK